MADSKVEQRSCFKFLVFVLFCFLSLFEMMGRTFLFCLILAKSEKEGVRRYICFCLCVSVSYMFLGRFGQREGGVFRVHG